MWLICFNHQNPRRSTELGQERSMNTEPRVSLKHCWMWLQYPSPLQRRNSWRYKQFLLRYILQISQSILLAGTLNTFLGHSPLWEVCMGKNVYFPLVTCWSHSIFKKNASFLQHSYTGGLSLTGMPSLWAPGFPLLDSDHPPTPGPHTDNGKVLQLFFNFLHQGDTQISDSGWLVRSW